MLKYSLDEIDIGRWILLVLCLVLGFTGKVSWWVILLFAVSTSNIILKLKRR